MKVLLVHNSYKIKGGEDSVLKNEYLMLEGVVDVDLSMVSNDGIDSKFSMVLVAVNSIFSIGQYFKWKRLLKGKNFDVVHVHNYFPIVSPSIFYACKSEGVPVIHTLHNFRAICPTALLSYKGLVTERSINSNSFWTLPRKVYRNSFLGTLFLILMVETHKTIGTWRKMVDGYIALTDFSKSKYVEAGWPEEKIFVKPNFSTPPKGLSIERVKPRFALYVGRLSEEKGIRFIVDSFFGTDFPLKIIGDGPERTYVVRKSGRNIEYLGEKPVDQVMNSMAEASCLIMASSWYEGFPMVILEAFSVGLPVVVPSLGNMAAVVDSGLSGLHYVPKNAEDFRKCVAKILECNREFQRLSNGALSVYHERYTQEANLEMLKEIYVKVIDSRKSVRTK